MPHVMAPVMLAMLANMAVDPVNTSGSTAISKWHELQLQSFAARLSCIAAQPRVHGTDSTLRCCARGLGPGATPATVVLIYLVFLT